MRVRGLSVTYPAMPGSSGPAASAQRPRILADLDLDFEAGGYTLVAGPTGSGKSTLALALVGALARATNATVTGTVEISGTDLSRTDPESVSSLVGAVWQRPDVQLHRVSVLDEVTSGPDYTRLPADLSAERASDLLAQVGLAHVDPAADVMRLSGGEQQRVALAAALAQDPDVLVLDEATSALDSAATAAFVAALDDARRRRAASARPLTVIAVDHRPDAHLGADRMIVLDGGSVVLDDTVEAIFSDHATQANHLGLRPPRTWPTPRPTAVEATATEGPDTAGRTDAAADGADGADGAADGADGAAGHATSGITVSGLDVGFRKYRVLSGVNLDLPAGSLVLLTGDNGSGKTTLLRALATELPHRGGRIRPRKRARVRAGIGYAPQRAASLMFTDTVRAELATATQGRGIDELLAATGLEHLADAHPLTLSGGQRQRLAVALAIAGDPAALFLDEPTSAQDRPGAARVLELVRDGHRNRVTVIATHDPDPWLPHATGVLTVTEGRVVW